ncbi:hypothetical protein DKX38_019681 [Salix brachista]|uniref:Dehydrin n=1 Tax=Salix brachista TaxID=2182728 RepID=A0A5N5KGX3_9ROSI|nr:hypothetical protein DKX38_019681 [Salix brachista]
MAGMMNKMEGQFGGKKEEQRKGEPQVGHGQQAPKCDTQGGQGQQVHNTQGERPEGFVDKIKDKIPGVGGDKHQGDTQGGCNQQGQGERKEGCYDKIPGVGGTGGVGGGGERKKHGRVKEVEVASTGVTDYHTKKKKPLLCSILCFPFLKWSTVGRQGRMYNWSLDTSTPYCCMESHAPFLGLRTPSPSPEHAWTSERCRGRIY